MQRFIALFSTVSFLWSTLLSPVVEANFWVERAAARSGAEKEMFSLPGLHSIDGLDLKRASRASSRLPGRLAERFPILSHLPLAYGTLHGAHAGPSHRLVLHIQDIHENGEAQTNSARMLKELAAQGVALVAVEGAAGAFDFSPWRAFPRINGPDTVADHFLAAGRISGSSYLGVTEERFPPVWGVDDREQYQLNVQAYRDSLTARPLVRRRLERVAAEMEALKAQYYSLEMRQLDRAVSEHRAGRTGLTAYVEIIAKFAGKAGPFTDKFLTMAAMERSLNFAAAERERDEWMRRATEKMDPATLSQLAQEALAHRAGAMTAAEFYVALRTAGEQVGVPLTSYPSFSAYVRYVLQGESIDAAGLSRELDGMREQAFVRTARTSEEAHLAGLSEQVSLVRGLVDFSLTPAEWGRMRDQHPSLSGLEAEMQAIAAGTQVPVTNTDDLATFLAFYGEAESRNQALVNNCIDRWNALGEGKSSLAGTVAVLITGGFHAEGIQERFKAEGISYVSLAPRIDHIPNGKSAVSYLDAFTRERTTLEKLFAGEKLFVLPAGAQVGAVDGLSVPGGDEAQGTACQLAIGRLTAVIRTHFEGGGKSPANASDVRQALAAAGAILGETVPLGIDWQGVEYVDGVLTTPILVGENRLVFTDGQTRKVSSSSGVLLADLSSGNRSVVITRDSSGMTRRTFLKGGIFALLLRALPVFAWERASEKVSGEPSQLYGNIMNSLQKWTVNGRSVLMVPNMDPSSRMPAGRQDAFRDVYHIFPTTVVLGAAVAEGDLKTATQIAEFWLQAYENKNQYPELWDKQGRFNGFPEVYKDLGGRIGKDPNLEHRGTGPTAWFGNALLNLMEALEAKQEDLEMRKRLLALATDIADWLVRLQVYRTDLPWLDGGILGAIDERVNQPSVLPHAEGASAAYALLRRVTEKTTPPKKDNFKKAADRLGEWFKNVVDAKSLRIYVGRTLEGGFVAGNKGPAEAIDTYAFAIMAGVVDPGLGKKMLDRLSNSGTFEKTVQAAEGSVPGLGFGAGANVPWWGPHAQVAHAAQLINHPWGKKLVEQLKTAAGRNKKRAGLAVFTPPSSLKPEDRVLDWQGQPSDSAWVGDIEMFANEPTAWTAMFRSRPGGYSFLGARNWSPVVKDGQPLANPPGTVRLPQGVSLNSLLRNVSAPVPAPTVRPTATSPVRSEKSQTPLPNNVVVGRAPQGLSVISNPNDANSPWKAVPRAPLSAPVAVNAYGKTLQAQASVGFAHDDNFLYAIFDVDDPFPEESADNNQWDSSGVAFVVGTGGRKMAQFRLSLFGANGDREGNYQGGYFLKPGTKLNSNEAGKGYYIVMQIQKGGVPNKPQFNVVWIQRAGAPRQHHSVVSQKSWNKVGKFGNSVDNTGGELIFSNSPALDLRGAVPMPAVLAFSSPVSSMMAENVFPIDQDSNAAGNGEGVSRRAFFGLLARSNDSAVRGGLIPRLEPFIRFLGNWLPEKHQNLFYRLVSGPGVEEALVFALGWGLEALFPGLGLWGFGVYSIARLVFFASHFVPEKNEIVDWGGRVLPAFFITIFHLVLSSVIPGDPLTVALIVWLFHIIVNGLFSGRLSLPKMGAVLLIAFGFGMFAQNIPTRVDRAYVHESTRPIASAQYISYSSRIDGFSKNDADALSKRMETIIGKAAKASGLVDELERLNSGRRFDSHFTVSIVISQHSVLNENVDGYSYDSDLYISLPNVVYDFNANHGSFFPHVNASADQGFGSFSSDHQAEEKLKARFDITLDRLKRVATQVELIPKLLNSEPMDAARQLESYWNSLPSENRRDVVYLFLNLKLKNPGVFKSIISHTSQKFENEFLGDPASDFDPDMTYSTPNGRELYLEAKGKETVRNPGASALTIWWLHRWFGDGMSFPDYSLFRAPRVETVGRAVVVGAALLVNLAVFQVPSLGVLLAVNVGMFVALHHLPGRPAEAPRGNVLSETLGALALSAPLLIVFGFLDGSGVMEGMSGLAQAAMVAGTVFVNTYVEEPVHRMVNRRAWSAPPGQVPDMRGEFQALNAMTALVNSPAFMANDTEARGRTMNLLSPSIGKINLDQVNGLFVVERRSGELDALLNGLMDAGLDVRDLRADMSSGQEEGEAADLAFRSALVVARNAVAAQWKAIRDADAGVPAREIDARIRRLGWLMGRANGLGARVELDMVVPLLFALRSVRSVGREYANFESGFRRYFYRGVGSVGSSVAAARETVRQTVAGGTKISEEDTLLFNLSELRGEGTASSAARKMLVTRVNALIEDPASVGPIVVTDTEKISSEEVLEELKALLSGTDGIIREGLEGELTRLVNGKGMYLENSPGVVREGEIYRNVRGQRATDFKMVAIVMIPELWSFEALRNVLYLSLTSMGKPVPLLPALEEEHQMDKVRGAMA